MKGDVRNAEPEAQQAVDYDTVERKALGFSLKNHKWMKCSR
jgi:hypothetical protein